MVLRTAPASIAVKKMYLMAVIYRLVSSTFKIVQSLVHSHFDLVSSVLGLDATEKVSQTLTEITVELINIHVISVQH